MAVAVTQDVGYRQVELGSVNEGGRDESNFIRTPSKVKQQDIRWSNINFKVKEKIILRDCWGFVPNGKLLAIMGPSGSGKSSLLNVLAGRSSSSSTAGIEISGNVEVAGVNVNPVQFRKNIAYVMQEDALLATATPREALRFSAMLRLSAETPASEIERIVEHLLEELGIMDCSDTLIGNILIKGISGGQKKRTSVGVEMITDPSLLFLDEPTSGLDSFAAYNLVKLLKTVASDGTAILCTIHQPSSEVFHMFDLVIFLMNGRVLYNGSVKDLCHHFSKFGFDCPEHYNPSDFVMMMSQTEAIQSLETKNMFFGTPDNYAKANSPQGALAAISSVFSEDIAFVEVHSSFFRQVYHLTTREFTNAYRDVASLIGRFGVTIFLNVLFGLIFKGAGSRDDSDSDNFSSHQGALTMISISAMFGSAQPTLLQFPFERPLFLREYSTGTYGATGYFLSKAFIELPLVFLQTLVAYALVWNICEFQGNFILMVLVSWGLGISSASLGVLMGCLVADVKKAAESAPLLFVPQILFAGFFIKIELIPIFLRWAQYLCSLKYALNLLILLEFDPTLDSCDGGARENCERIFEVNEIYKDRWWVYLIILFSLFFGFRVLAGFLLAQKAKKFY